MESILWLLLSVLVIIALGIGYYGTVICNLLSVACQMLHTISFHTNTTNQKLATLSPDASGKQNSQSIVLAIESLAERIEGGKEVASRRRKSTREFLMEEEQSQESMRALSEVSDVLREHLERSEEMDMALVSYLAEMIQDIKDLRSAVYSIRKIREFMEALSRDLCKESTLVVIKTEAEKDEQALEKIIDKIEADQRAHTLSELQYRDLLRDHVPSDQIDNLEIIDHRIREHKIVKTP